MRKGISLVVMVVLAATLFVGATDDTGAHGPPSTYDPHMHGMASCPAKPGWVPSNGNCVYPFPYWCDTTGPVTKVWYWVKWYAWHGGYLGSTSQWAYTWSGCYW